MTTMAVAIKQFIQTTNHPVTRDEIKQHITSQFPERWKASTLQAHIYGCSVNNPKAYEHHPSTEKFLFDNLDGTFSLYIESEHGPRDQWVPQATVDDSSELVAASISLERDIEAHLIDQLQAIEAGLEFEANQVVIEIGRVDILARDRAGERVIIEIKVGEAKDSTIGQIARYMGWYSRQDGKPCRGTIVASDFGDGVRYAASAIPGLVLQRYKVQFSFEQVRT